MGGGSACICGRGDRALTGGIVYLVGAVPGAPDLITQRGLRHLRGAGALLYDPGVPPALLAQAPLGCERFAAPGGEASPDSNAPAGSEALHPNGAASAETITLLRSLVAAGSAVCWLTAGAPSPALVAQLEAAGLPYEAVPAPVGQLARGNLGERLPLAGVRVLVTRARSQAGALSDRLAALGGEPWEVPVIAIVDPPSWEALDEAVRRIGEYRWLVLTSANGVRSFMARLLASSKDVRALGHLQVVAVGSVTAAALAAAGIRADLVPEQFHGAALPPLLAPHLRSGDRVLMARSEIADPAYAEGLRALGAQVDDVIAYRTVPEPVDGALLRAALAAGEVDYVTFTASSTVRHLLAALDAGGGAPRHFGGARIAAIGSETAKALRAAGLPVDVQARVFTVDGLVEALVQDVTNRRESRHGFSSHPSPPPAGQ